jgi:hypothetical protein
MFTFINTSILALIVAIAIPLLIHLFNKQRKKKIKFSSLRFLQILEKQRLKRIKIYDYLLILLRTLIILCLVLAFARPTLTTSTLFSSKNARTTAVIILDNGINMSRYDDQGSRYLRAQSVLNKLIQKFNPEDDLYIIQSSSPSNFWAGQTAPLETNGSFVHGKWSDALKNAGRLFAEHPNFNQELHIISDFQYEEKAFENLLPELSDIRIFLIKIGDEIVTNFGIKTVEIKSQIFEVNKPIKLEAQIINSTPDQFEPVEIHLFIDQQRVAHQRLYVEPQSTKEVTLSFSPKTVGHLSGYIEISDDDLLADNRYYFALKIPTNIKLLFTDDNPSVFLKAAFSSLADQTDAQIVSEKYNSWARQNFLAYDILILSNFSSLPSSIIQRLKKYLNGGGAILLIPGLNTIPVEYNRFASTLGMTTTIKELINTNDENEFYYLKRPNFNHPIFSGLFVSDDPELSRPKFSRYFKFALSSKDQAILSFQNNDPFLIKADHSSGSIFVISSYINDGWTDIQYRGIFLPLLSRIIHFGASHASQVQTSTIVENEQTVVLNQVSQTGEFYLKLPNGEKNRIVPQPQDQRLQFHLKNIKEPGLYHLQAGEKIISSVPVNVETNAIHQTFIDLESITNQETVQLFSETDNYEDAIIQARFGFELWKILVILALIFLVLELFVIKKMEGKVSTSEQKKAESVPI